MNSYKVNLLREAIKSRKMNVLSEYAKIIFPDKPNLVLESYSGDCVRVFKHKGDVVVLHPDVVGYMESDYLSNAIATGTIFDDADTVDNAATYVVKTGLPENAMIRQGLNPPVDVMMAPVGAAIGTVSGDTLDVDNTNIRNGWVAMRDMVGCCKPDCDHDYRDCINNAIGVDDRMDTPESLSGDLYEIKTAMSELEKFDDTDFEPEEDLIDYDIDIETETVSQIPGSCTPGTEGSTPSTNPIEATNSDSKTKTPVRPGSILGYKQEGFLSKKPKQLKPIDARSIIAYITTQKNAIRDTNDQAMLAAYTCAKLETCDFYLSCLDTNDGRYIVPHDRTFLMNYQRQLNTLLTEILKLKPVDKQDRVWKVSVDYPDGWKGARI
jgi:hypothetical protein